MDRSDDPPTLTDVGFRYIIKLTANSIVAVSFGIANYFLVFSFSAAMYEHCVILIVSRRYRSHIDVL